VHKIQAASKKWSGYSHARVQLNVGLDY